MALRLTFGQLVDAANAKRIEEWDKTAMIAALIYNANRGDNPPTSPEDWHPIRGSKKRKRKRSKYTAAKVASVHDEMCKHKPVVIMDRSKMQVIDDAN